MSHAMALCTERDPVVNIKAKLRVINGILEMMSIHTSSINPAVLADVIISVLDE